MIKYTIEKHNNIWSVWKTVDGHGVGFMAIYTPLEKNTKKECQLWCKTKGIKVKK